MSKSFWKAGLGAVCLFLAACAPQKPLVTTPPAPVPAPSVQNGQPDLSNAPTVVALVPALQGERPELQRRILGLSLENLSVPPEDYEKGMILSELPAPTSPAGTALNAARHLLQDLKAGTKTEGAGPSKRLIDQLLASHQTEFHDTQVIRVLTPYRVEHGRAAFTIRLLGVDGSATLSIFLKLADASTEGQWMLEDLQGDLTHMTEDGRNRYNDYVPQDIERNLIREGHAKPWL